MRMEEAGVEILSYLSDATISLADETSALHRIFNSLPQASSGGAPGSGPTTRSDGGPRLGGDGRSVLRLLERARRRRVRA